MLAATGHIHSEEMSAREASNLANHMATFAVEILYSGMAFETKALIYTGSRIAGRSIAEVFDQFPELLAVAIIRDHLIQLPRGSTRLKGGDQLLIAASEVTSIEAFKRLAGSSAD